MDISNLCLVNSIILEAQWIPRSLNEKADLLSRFVDKDDWSVNPSVFRVIDAKWGPHTIDRFASHYNAQVPRFNYKFSSPGCSGVDALAQVWLDKNSLVSPPVSAIVPSVRALSSCSGYGTLIVPQWPSAYFFFRPFTWMFICTQFIDQLPVGLLTQLVERCTGIAEVMGSYPVRA